MYITIGLRHYNCLFLLHTLCQISMLTHFQKIGAKMLIPHSKYTSKFSWGPKSQTIPLRPTGVKKLRLSLETVLPRGHTSVLLFHREILCPLPLSISFSFARRQTPFKTPWLIIYPGNEMPKPRETHHQERKGHSNPAHRFTLFNTHSHTTVMDGNNIFIRASGRQSFHPRVQIPSRPRAKQKLEWWGEIFKKTSKKPSFKNPSHARGDEPSDQ